jgi:hypothetical protein
MATRPVTYAWLAFFTPFNLASRCFDSAIPLRACAMRLGVVRAIASNDEGSRSHHFPLYLHRYIFLNISLLLNLSESVLRKYGPIIASID